MPRFVTFLLTMLVFASCLGGAELQPLRPHLPFDGLYAPPAHAQVAHQGARDGLQRLSATLEGPFDDHVEAIERELRPDRWPQVTVERSEFDPPVVNWTAERAEETLVIYLYQAEDDHVGRLTVTYLDRTF